MKLKIKNSHAKRRKKMRLKDLFKPALRSNQNQFNMETWITKRCRVFIWIPLTTTMSVKDRHLKKQWRLKTVNLLQSFSFQFFFLPLLCSHSQRRLLHSFSINISWVIFKFFFSYFKLKRNNKKERERKKKKWNWKIN